MYAYEGLYSLPYLLLYGAAMMLLIIGGVYLLFRPANLFSPTIRSSASLRYWAAACLFAGAASHVWWPMIGQVWLADDRLVRNIINITLDRLTIMQLMMILLVRMLQNSRRPLWPIFASYMVLVGIAAYGISTRSADTERWIHVYMNIVCFIFVLWYLPALWRYNRWLRDNFSDLQHKEIWQSLAFLVIALGAYSVYTQLFTDMTSEYSVQIGNFFLVAFIVWRVETLQDLHGYEQTGQLDAGESEQESLPEPAAEESKQARRNNNSEIEELLRKNCEQTGLYLEHDLTLAQLALAIRTNRTYLGQYFADQGMSYNAYINGLRVDHFCRLYSEALESGNTVSAHQLALQSGFSAYTTFYTAFKARKGQTLTQWAKEQKNADE